MLDFQVLTDPHTGNPTIHTSVHGKPLLTSPQLNKGTAFTEQERIDFGLLGKLPIRIETLEEQVQRTYKQFSAFSTKLQQHIYLTSLQNKNEVLFYSLVSRHLDEMVPVIYTPIVGKAVKEFNTEFRDARGLYIAYPQIASIASILDNRTNPEIDLIVVTDGESVLGIGDQGVGGMDIPIAKLMVYTLCGGINPARTLPILLDVGTNNQALLENPLYLGWRHPRIHGKEYDDFIDQFVQTIKQKFPHVFLHWEDFGRDNARRNLHRSYASVCTFNDDMQGTGVVTLAAIIAAVKANNSTLAKQRIIVFGAGTAGTGISDQIQQVLIREGLTEDEARQRFWLIDKAGLLLEDMLHLTPEQRAYARARNEVATWSCDPDYISLLDVVKQVHPTILIGCSSVKNAFDRTLIETMAAQVARPIILPLSNPTDNVEAQPADILNWTQGRAFVASGSPFAPVQINGKTLRISQCNNAFVFPGIGLGIIASKATSLTENMLWAACDALVSCSPIMTGTEEALLPTLGAAQEVAQKMALALALQAQHDGVAPPCSVEETAEAIQRTVWQPKYLPFVRKHEE